MLNQSDFSRYFYNGGTPTNPEDYEIELTVDALLGDNKIYPINIEALNTIQANVAASFEATTAAWNNQIGHSYNPNSNKDLAAKMESLHLGVAIPRTEKGNLSMTREWLDANADRHAIFHLASAWRRGKRLLSTINQIKSALVLIEDIPMLPTTWRTYSENGSGRIVSENYPIGQLPTILRPCVDSGESIWINVALRNFDLWLLAFLSGDSKFQEALRQDMPFEILAQALNILDPGLVRPFFNFMLYENYSEQALSKIVGHRDLAFLQTAYPILYAYLDSAIMQTYSTKVVPLGIHSRSRNLALDPEAKDRVSLRRKTLSSLCQQNEAFLLKHLLWTLLLGVPSLEFELWIPTQHGVSFTTSIPFKDDIHIVLQDWFRQWEAQGLKIPADVLVSGTWLDLSEEA